MMKIERYNYAEQFSHSIDSLVPSIKAALLGGHYILGEEVFKFESEFAEYLNVKHVIGVNSGTDALVLALMARGIGAGDEVIVQANTFYATAAAVMLVGAMPVLVDADPHNFLMDLNMVEDQITTKTKAILPAHLYGKMSNILPISSILEKHGIDIIEDAAQAHGAMSKQGDISGTVGIAGCFSFHPSKNLGAAGDAGAICTNSDDLAMKLKVRRSLGQQHQNNHVTIGLNSKLDTLQALVLSSKLPKLEEWNLARARIANEYRSRLNNLPLAFQHVEDGEKHVYHLFQIRSKNRDALQKFLLERGVDAVTRYPYPIHLQMPFRILGYGDGAFPNAEALANELLALPIRPDMPIEEINYVCDSVKSFFRS